MAGTLWMGRWGERHRETGRSAYGDGRPSHSQNLLAFVLTVCKVTQRRVQITERRSRDGACEPRSEVRGGCCCHISCGSRRSPEAAPGARGAAESVSERPCQGRRGTTPLPPTTPALVPHQPSLTPPRTPGPPSRAAGEGGSQDSSPLGVEAGRE